MPRSPLVPFALALVAGITLEAHALAFAGAAGVALTCMVRRDTALGLALGLVIATVFGHPFAVTRELPTAHYAGTVVGEVRNDEGGTTFAFAVAGIGTLRATARTAVRAGERLTVRARIEPFDEARNPGEPSARAIAQDDGECGRIRIARILGRAAPDPHDPRVWMPLARAWASHVVHARLPPQVAAVVAGALWGERDTIPASVRDDFQATGTVHVLVTAGLHLGVLAAALAFLARWTGIPRIAAALGTIPLVYLYAWLSGWHLPSQRAAAMIAVGLIARAAGRRAVSLNTLALAAIVVACAWPVAVDSVSFALSFSCVAAIVLFAPAFARALRARRVAEPVAETLAITAAAQLGVWPLSAATFFALAPYAVLANAIVVPSMGFVLIGGAALLAVHDVPLLGAGVARLDEWLITLVLAVTHAVASLPGARLTVAPPPAWAIGVYDVLVLGARIAAARSRRIAVAMVAAGCAIALGAPAVQSTPRLQITMLDVGQGDAIVVRTREQTVMIDTGGRLERGGAPGDESPAEKAAARIVVPYVERSGIRTIDVLILTHPHGDHTGGCLPLLRAVRVREILDSGQPYAGRAYRDCMAEAHRIGVPVTVARRGMRRTLDSDTTLDVLAPTDVALHDTGDDINENSIVLRLTGRGGSGVRHALFMGDAGEAREAELLAAGIDISADIRLCSIY